MNRIVHFLATLLLYALCDLAFINLFAQNFIREQVGPLLAPAPDLVAAGVFYLIFTGGLLYFCVWPAPDAGKALLNGALFGLVTYATYELVNKSLLAGWPLRLVLVDMAWGVFVGAVLSWTSWHIGVRLKAMA